MTTLLNEFEYKELADAAEDQSLGAVFCYSIPEAFKASKEFTFKQQTEVFFYVLTRLLNDGRIRLARDGKFLKGSSNELVSQFRKSFPHTEKELLNGIWFYDDTCPGEVVWVRNDGSFSWAFSGVGAAKDGSVEWV